MGRHLLRRRRKWQRHKQWTDHVNRLENDSQSQLLPFQSGRSNIVLSEGDSWRETLIVPSSGLPNTPITFGAYGSGDNPIIKSSNLYTNWKLEDSYYFAQISNTPNQVFKDGTRLKKVATKSSLVTGKWYWDAGDTRIYLYDNPTGHTIEASQRNTCITIDGKSYITVQDLDLRYANADGIRITNAVIGATVSNSNISYAWSNGIYSYTTGTDYRDSLLITNNTISYCGASGVLLSDYTRNSTVSHNNLNHNSLIHGTDGIHEFSAGIYIGLQNTSYITTEYNVTEYNGVTQGSDEGYGIWYDTVNTPGSIMRYNIARNNTEAGLRFENTTGGQMYYNLSYNNYIGIMLNGSDVTATYPNSGNYVFNNTVYGNTQYGIMNRGYTAIADTCINNIFKNNISVGNGVRQLYAIRGGENDGTVGYGNVYAYNSFGPEATGFIEWQVGATKNTYADWEMAYGGTTHSVQSDPLLTAPTATPPDFTLQSTSPAINAGTNVGLTKDFAGNAIVGNPDIGAYEFLAPSPAPTQCTATSAIYV